MSSLFRSSRRGAMARQVQDSLREHPVFEAPDERSTSGEPETDDAKISALETVAGEESRESAWRNETQRLFLRRTQVVCGLGVVGTPLFWLLYTRLAPDAIYQVSFIHLMLIGASIVIFWLARYSPSPMIARILAVILYGIFGLAAACAVAAAGERRISALSGHHQLLLTILLMPFSGIEAAICAALVTLSFTLGLGNALTADQWQAFVPRVVSFAVLGIMISVMSHLQNVVRRRAFDSAFDMAASATRNAQLSTLDSITGGWNRRYLEMALSKELKRVVRLRQPAALFMFDLDNFKRVNDQLGHPVGDNVLRAVHNSACNTLRNIDTLARYGGDEFAVILPGLRTQDALQAATRLSDSVSRQLVETFGAESLQGQVTLSIGVTTIPGGENLSFVEAIQRADERLYEAKRAGKNRIRVG